jgi:hypothetical protein
MGGIDTNQLNQQLAVFNQKITDGTNFLINKLKNFKNLTLGEQIAFGCMGGGLFLIILSIIFFLI